MSITARKVRLKKKVFYQKIRRCIILLFCFFLIGYLLIITGSHLYKLCLFHSAQTVVAKQGSLAVSFPGEGIILRKEVLVRTSLPGTVVFHVSEGTKVAAKTDVATINAAPDLTGKATSLTIQSPISGIVCLSWDGSEEILKPEDWQNFNIEDLFSEKYRREIKTIDKTVENGYPVYKIIDYLVNPKVVIKIKNKDTCFTEEQKVVLEWDQGKQVSGKVKKTWVKAGCCYLVVEIQEKAAALPQERFLELHLLPVQYEGIVIPSSAIVKKEATEGIFTASLNCYCFQAVNVIGKVEDNVIIEGISRGEEVLIGPKSLFKLLLSELND